MQGREKYNTYRLFSYDEDDILDENSIEIVPGMEAIPNSAFEITQPAALIAMVTAENPGRFNDDDTSISAHELYEYLDNISVERYAALIAVTATAKDIRTLNLIMCTNGNSTHRLQALNEAIASLTANAQTDTVKLLEFMYGEETHITELKPSAR